MKMLNKIIGSSIAIAAVLAFSASTTQAQNLLVNGSFENSGLITPNPITPTGPGAVNAGWALYGATAVSDMSSSPDSPEDGVYALLTQNNTWGGAGTYQIITPTIQVGATYTFSIYALTDNGLNPNYSTPIELILNFVGPWNGTTYPTIATTQSAQDDTFAFQPGVDTWSLLSVSAVAPAGAYGIDIQPQTINGNAPAGAPPNIYFDNASLTVAPIPEPSTLALLGMGLAVPFYFIRRRKS